MLTAPRAPTGLKPTSVVSSEPMLPHVVNWVKDPTEIVFIDPQVPDAQVLAQGAKPGVEVVMLDANSDGVKQIANFLARHPDPNLTTIDIVAHGADGMVQLGNTILSSSNVGYYESQLAAIGNAMQPGGTIQIFGCDVGQDMNGDLFLVQLSQAIGGKNVDAASGLVGAAALGGTWTLDVEVGGAPTANPFTDATLAAFPDVLPDEIFITTIAGGPDTASDYRVEEVSSTGSASIVLKDTTPETPIAQPVDIAVDPLHGVYYLIDANFLGVPGHNGTQTIEVGKINGTTFADGKTLDPLFSIPGGAGAFFGLAIDPLNNVLLTGRRRRDRQLHHRELGGNVYRYLPAESQQPQSQQSQPFIAIRDTGGNRCGPEHAEVADARCAEPDRLFHRRQRNRRWCGPVGFRLLNTATNQIYEAKLPLISKFDLQATRS